jgi:hypothetical protein
MTATLALPRRLASPAVLTISEKSKEAVCDVSPGRDTMTTSPLSVCPVPAVAPPASQTRFATPAWRDTSSLPSTHASKTVQSDITQTL